MRLKQIRGRRKLTQAQLAKKVGVHAITVSRIERGERRPSMALLQRLAKALGVKAAKLID